MAENKAPDMNDEELMVLMTEYEVHRQIIDSNSKTAEIGRKKRLAWKAIAESVNAISSIHRSEDQIKIKIKNIKSKAKTKSLEVRKSVSGTGGGPPMKRLSVAEERMCTLYEHTAGWNGVPGGRIAAKIKPNSSDATLITASTTDAEEPDASSSSMTAVGQAATTQSNKISTIESRASQLITTESNRSQTGLNDIRKLQVRALETQIEANLALISTCNAIKNTLIPALMAANGVDASVLRDLEQSFDA